MLHVSITAHSLKIDYVFRPLYRLYKTILNLISFTCWKWGENSTGHMTVACLAKYQYLIIVEHFVMLWVPVCVPQFYLHQLYMYVKNIKKRWRHKKTDFRISVFWIPCIGGAWWKTSTAQIGWESVHGGPRYGRMNTYICN